MKFVLEVDLTAGAVADAPLEELGRILRYWAGNVKHYPLQPGSGETISDSTYAPVGSWTITGTGSPAERGSAAGASATD